MSRKQQRVEVKRQDWLHLVEPDDDAAEVEVEPDSMGDEAWRDAVAEHESMQVRQYERSSK